MLFPQERKSRGGTVMQEPGLWISWQQKTPDIRRKEPEASQKIAKLMKYLNAGHIMSWVFLLMLHGVLTSIKADEKVKLVLRKRTSYFRNTRKTYSDHHPVAWAAGSLWTQAVCTQSSACTIAWWAPVPAAPPGDDKNNSRQWNYPRHCPSL